MFIKITHALTNECRRYALRLKSEIELAEFLSSIPFGPFGRVFLEEESGGGEEIVSTFMLREILKEMENDGVLRLSFLPYETTSSTKKRTGGDVRFHGFAKCLMTMFMASMMHIIFMLTTMRIFGCLFAPLVIYPPIFMSFYAWKKRVAVLSTIRRIERSISHLGRRFTRCSCDMIRRCVKFLKKNRTRVLQILLLVVFLALCAGAFSFLLKTRGHNDHHHCQQHKFERHDKLYVDGITSTHHNQDHHRRVVKQWRERTVRAKQQRRAEQFLHGLGVLTDLKQRGRDVEGKIVDVDGVQFSKDGKVYMDNAYVKVNLRLRGTQNRKAWLKWSQVRPIEPIRCRQAHRPSFDCVDYKKCNYDCIDDWCVYPSRTDLKCDAKSCSWEVLNAIPNYYTGKCARIAK